MCVLKEQRSRKGEECVVKATLGKVSNISRLKRVHVVVFLVLIIALVAFALHNPHYETTSN